MFFRDPSIATIRLQWNPKPKRMSLAKFFFVKAAAATTLKDFLK
jgi:hypothetical protein